MKQLVCISLILISTTWCLGQVENKAILKYETDKYERIFFTKELSEKYGLPQLPFSIVVPEGYSYQFNHKTRSAIRIYKYEGDSLINEIIVAISSFDKKYSVEQEKQWLEEFKNSPQAKQNPDFSIRVYTDYLLLGTKRHFYTYSIDNTLGKYPVNIPLNSVGITYPGKDGWSGLAIVVTKWNIDADSPLSEIEKEIINSIQFE